MVLGTNTSSASVRAKEHSLERKTWATILVVEDVEEIASHMEQALIQRGHKVIRALNAEEAIQIAEQALPAVVLTDPELATFDRLLELVSEHRQLKEMPLAIIDIDERQLNHGRVKVLRDFDALDNLVDSLRSSRP
jgi:CheY-like chemotaxis protein